METHRPPYIPDTSELDATLQAIVDAGIAIEDLPVEDQAALVQARDKAHEGYWMPSDAGIDLLPHQWGILTDTFGPNETMLSGSAGSGKSYALIVLAMMQAANCPNSVIIMHRSQWDAAKNSWRDPLRPLLDTVPGTQYNMVENTARFVNGSKIMILASPGLEELRRKLHGIPRVDLFLADEVGGDLSPDMHKYLMTRLRSPDPTSRPRFIAATNPIGRHLSYWKDWATKPDAPAPTPATWETPTGQRQYKHLQLADNPHMAAYMHQLEVGDAVSRATFLDGSWEVQASDDAIFSIESIQHYRGKAPQEFKRTVVGVDPSVSGKDRTGICVAGMADDGTIWVTADYTMQGMPSEWATQVVEVFHQHEADYVAVESNQGRELLRDAIKRASGDTTVPVKLVPAYKSKGQRAYPISILIEQGQCRLTDAPNVENLIAELAGFTGERRGRWSPDAVDAMVWAVSDLASGRGRTASFAVPGGSATNSYAGAVSAPSTAPNLRPKHARSDQRRRVDAPVRKLRVKG